MPTKINEVDSAELWQDIRQGNYSLTVGCVMTDEGHISVGLSRDASVVEVLAEERLHPDDAESLGDTVDHICETRQVAAGIKLDAEGLQGLVRLVMRGQELCRLAHPLAEAV